MRINIPLQHLKRCYSSTAHAKQDVVIVSAMRTPVGTFKGGLKSLSATELGAIAVQGAVDRSGLKDRNLVTEVIMGNVYSAGLGQAPARQAALKAGLSESTVCTTVNKLCASGLKSVTMGASSILLGHHAVVACGGMESMSRVPFYLAAQARDGFPIGNIELVDGILGDGLVDSFYKMHMGECSEETAVKYNIGRKEQDAYATRSYKRAAEAFKNGVFKNEIIPIKVEAKKGATTMIEEDEEYRKVDYEKFPHLKTVFKKEGGTITAANASKMNDGASALLLMSRSKAQELGLQPLALIRAFADAETNPKMFTIAPSLATPIALKRAGVTMKDISLFEINEAFSVVALANQQIMELDPAKVNVHGGAVALGHAVGSSGARILVTLVHALKKGQLGCASICNGGGGATAMVIEKLG